MATKNHYVRRTKSSAWKTAKRQMKLYVLEEETLRRRREYFLVYYTVLVRLSKWAELHAHNGTRMRAVNGDEYIRCTESTQRIHEIFVHSAAAAVLFNVLFAVDEIICTQMNKTGFGFRTNPLDWWQRLFLFSIFFFLHRISTFNSSEFIYFSHFTVTFIVSDG